MSTKPPGESPKDDQFAPYDYTDGRKFLQWETRYPENARSLILLEAKYLLRVFFGYTVLLFLLLYYSCSSLTPVDNSLPLMSGCDFFWAICAAWAAGCVGGCLFGMKWLYHSVAKGMWNEDRTYWRALTPHMSGASAIFIVFVIASGLIQVFNKEITHNLIGVVALGFLAGYFSDKALAKLSEIADILFGATNSRRTKPKTPSANPGGPPPESET